MLYQHHSLDVLATRRRVSFLDFNYSLSDLLVSQTSYGFFLAFPSLKLKTHRIFFDILTSFGFRFQKCTHMFGLPWGSQGLTYVVYTSNFTNLVRFFSEYTLHISNRFLITSYFAGFEIFTHSFFFKEIFPMVRISENLIFKLLCFLKNRPLFNADVTPVTSLLTHTKNKNK